jgi:hypothetical protein
VRGPGGWRGRRAWGRRRAGKFGERAGGLEDRQVFLG